VAATRFVGQRLTAKNLASVMDAVIEMPQRYKHHGKLHGVRTDVTVPGAELIEQLRLPWCPHRARTYHAIGQ
jgi:hypothetical protein